MGEGRDVHGREGGGRGRKVKGRTGAEGGGWGRGVGGEGACEEGKECIQGYHDLGNKGGAARKAQLPDLLGYMINDKGKECIQGYLDMTAVSLEPEWQASGLEGRSTDHQGWRRVEQISL